MIIPQQIKDFVNIELTSVNCLGSIVCNGFSYPEWRRDMDPKKPSNLSLLEKGAKPFANVIEDV